MDYIATISLADTSLSSMCLLNAGDGWFTQPNKWRMIFDLSSPIDRSVNDGISPDLCSLQYSRVDEAVKIICHLGQDAQLIKLDIKDAYRIAPTYPADYTLLGIKWQSRTYTGRSARPYTSAPSETPLCP